MDQNIYLLNFDQSLVFAAVHTNVLRKVVAGLVNAVHFQVFVDTCFDVDTDYYAAIVVHYSLYKDIAVSAVNDLPSAVAPVSPVANE